MSAVDLTNGPSSKRGLSKESVASYVMSQKVSSDESDLSPCRVAQLRHTTAAVRRARESVVGLTNETPQNVGSKESVLFAKSVVRREMTMHGWNGREAKRERGVCAGIWKLNARDVRSGGKGARGGMRIKEKDTNQTPENRAQSCFSCCALTRRSINRLHSAHLCVKNAVFLSA